MVPGGQQAGIQQFRNGRGEGGRLSDTWKKEIRGKGGHLAGSQHLLVTQRLGHLWTGPGDCSSVSAWEVCLPAYPQSRENQITWGAGHQPLSLTCNQVLCAQGCVRTTGPAGCPEKTRRGLGLPRSVRSLLPSPAHLQQAPDAVVRPPGAALGSRATLRGVCSTCISEMAA